jgi:hypothetical protein
MYEFDVGTLSTYHDMEWTSKEGPDRKKNEGKEMT